MRPLVMGVVNVTPDSFSDGGDTPDVESAIIHGRKLAADGADILDIGGESTRPGSSPISVDTEMARVLPVITALADDGFLISVDTRNSVVMEAATGAGAKIINDVSALEGEGSLSVAASSGASVILMHKLGDPGTMQSAPVYDNVTRDVRAYLAGRIKACEDAGLDRDRIAIDPGIGFGKDLSHNLALLTHLDEFSDLQVPLVLGVSRKSFIGRLSAGGGSKNAKDRLGGSLAAALAGVARGASILRVHDVAETRQALDVWMAIESGS